MPKEVGDPHFLFSLSTKHIVPPKLREKVKDEVMFNAVFAKFTQHKTLCQELLDTGDATLVEHTANDSYWGDGGDGSEGAIHVEPQVLGATELGEGRQIVNPVTRISLRLPKPLPRHLKDDQVRRLFDGITDLRDRAMFMLMLRCGLRVQEVADLTVDAVGNWHVNQAVFACHGYRRFGAVLGQRQQSSSFSAAKNQADSVEHSFSSSMNTRWGGCRLSVVADTFCTNSAQFRARMHHLRQRYSKKRWISPVL